MKHAFGAGTCLAVLVASLTACAGADDKSGLPVPTGGSAPTTTTSSRPATPLPTGTRSGSGQVALAAHSTYTYGDLKVVVNFPADIPTASRPSMRLFSEFLQARGRTTERNKLDPSLSGLASADVVKYVRGTTGGAVVQVVGSVTYTVKTVQTATSGYTLITGCLDQSRLVQVRKDGSRFVGVGAKTYPKLKMNADINRGMTGLKVTTFTFAPGSC